MGLAASDPSLMIDGKGIALEYGTYLSSQQAQHDVGPVL
jgi:hypothetical protein